MGVKMEATIVGLFQEQKANYIHSDARKPSYLGMRLGLPSYFRSCPMFTSLFHLHAVLTIV